MKSVSLIIPFFNELDEIKKILSTIPNWTLLPNEILIINTAFDQEPTNIKNYDSSLETWVLISESYLIQMHYLARLEILE